MDDKELLARLDERSINTYKLIEKVEKHLTGINGTIIQNSKDIAASKTDRRNIWWAITVCLIGLVGFLLMHFMG